MQGRTRPLVVTGSFKNVLRILVVAEWAMLVRHGPVQQSWIVKDVRHLCFTT